jgi:CRP/FNR family transcriptional regulator, cyclic AMP receptor protein
MNESSALRQHPIMRGLSDEQVGQLLPCANEVEFGEGDLIFREGEEADTVYLVRAGCVALEQNVPGRGVFRLETLRAGELLGLSWLIPGTRWTLDARCIAPVRVYALRADCVRQRMKEDPSLGLEFLTRVAHEAFQRLVHVRLQRLDVYKAG